jgi:two-component system, cell cycle sensor histidine kinase and response regulator CckA
MTDEGVLRRERDLATERFVLMCRAMNQCMWDWDMRTNIAWYSEAVYTVYGIDPKLTPSLERWSTYVHPDDRDRVIAGFRDVIDSGKSEWLDEYRFVRPNDGTVLEVIDRGFVIFDDGRPVRLAGVVMDVTHQRALERQLRHAQKMEAIGQLAGGIAHDFNNMLQAARLELELLRAAPTAPSKVLAHAREIGNVVDRAASLTRQLMMLSRIEAMRAEPVDLNAKITELGTMLRRLLGDNATLSLELASGVVEVEADSPMLDQVLINLAINARDAMVGAGTLAIATTRCGRCEPPRQPAGSYVCIEVRDTGIGIPREVLPRIFEPFFTTKSSGSGLGLATVYSIVEQHGGWIDVDSAIGRGTTFRVYLPERAGAVPRAATSEPRTNARGNETILLVEDDGSIRRALATLLEDHGYDVLVANSGAAALAVWESAGGKIDLLVTDLKMAGMTGHELATAVAARTPGVAILMMTGHGRDIDPSVTAGYKVLRKPFECEHLLSAVRTCLDQRVA